METVGLACPVNGIRVNEHAVRLIAAQVIVVAVSAWWFQQPLITLFLLIDFGLRAFGAGKFSALRQSATGMVHLLKLSPKPTDASPKQFAALLGLFVVSALLVCQLLVFPITALVIVSMLVLFATLESVFAYCVGCMLYQLLPRKQ